MEKYCCSGQDNQSSAVQKDILYKPLEEINVSLITPTGLQIIRCDENLNRNTMLALIKTEGQLLRQRKYRKYSYLLAEHDEKVSFEETFSKGNEIGLMHVAALVKENLEQSFAELVAAYSSDRNIPFIAGLILLREYERIRGSFFYCERTYDNSVKYINWSPRRVNQRPPVNLFKMSKSGYETVGGAQDDYAVTILRSVMGNRKAAAAIAKVSRQTFSNKLYKIGYLLPDGNVREDYDEWVKEQAKNKSSSKTKRKRPGVSEKKLRIKKLSDEEITKMYIQCKYNKSITAEKLGVGIKDFRRRLDIIYPGADKVRGVPDQLIQAAMNDSGGDIFETAEYLDLTPGWLIRRLKMINERSTADIGIVEPYPDIAEEANEESIY